MGDFDNCGSCNPPAPLSLNDGEVSRDGNSIALVRGDSGEALVTYKNNGTPPAKPSVECGFTGATGDKFLGPTWSQDGHTLAWQEGNGIWSDSIPDVTNCSSYGNPALIVANGKEPDFGPAAVNPGARPPCGNPGNPAACPAPGPACCSPAEFKSKLVSLLGTEARALSKLKIRGLLKKHQLKVSFTAPASARWP